MGLVPLLPILLAAAGPASPLLPVLMQNEHIAVVAKPPSVPCHNLEINSGAGRRHRRRVASGATAVNGAEEGDTGVPPSPTVLRMARDTFPGLPIHLVHRLDAATSGCLLLAFSPKAAAAAAAALADGSSRKTYYALCRGNGASLRARGGSFFTDGDVKDSRGIVRTAETELEGLWGSDGGDDGARRCCLVRARPRTGRWHQVRQHLGRENFPIVGETRHHKDIRENRAWGEILAGRGIPQRPCLHCHRLEIGADAMAGGVLAECAGLDVRCPLHPDMQAIVDLTEWSGEAREALPELFQPFPTAMPLGNNVGGG